MALVQGHMDWGMDSVLPRFIVVTRPNSVKWENAMPDVLLVARGNRERRWLEKRAAGSAGPRASHQASSPSPFLSSASALISQ